MDASAGNRMAGGMDAAAGKRKADSGPVPESAIRATKRAATDSKASRQARGSTKVKRHILPHVFGELAPLRDYL